MDHGKMHQDLLTKFCILRPIKNKYPTEAAAQHMDSFPLLGAPAILQSDNGTEFIAHVISEMKDFQPALVMVHSKPHHPQSQGSVERANGDIKDMLVAWLADNDTDEWVTGINFVQFQKNSAHHSGIKRSPYSALFCEEVRVVLTSSMPKEVLSKLDSKEGLLDVIMDQPSEEPSSSNIRSSALRFQCSSHPPFLVFQPSSVSSVPAILGFQCSTALRFQCPSHPPFPVFQRPRFPWGSVLRILWSQKAPTLRK